MTRPALIIFDCDGVLVNSEPITNRLLAEDLTCAGLPVTPEEAIDLFAGGTIASVHVRAREMGADLADDWVEGFYPRMIGELAADVEIIPGVAAVIDRVDVAGIPTCVASNGPMLKMEVTLGVTGLWERFAGRIYSAHDVGIAKPDPGLFLHAARAMGADPAETVVIEDSVSGVKAAHSAGMRCLGFTRDTPTARLTAHGAVPFTDMADVPALLGLEP